MISKLFLNIILPAIWLSIAPLVTVIHLTVGHAILHHANPHSRRWSPRLSSTASAGAIGGTILGLPLVPLFIYLMFIRALQRLNKHRREHPEDGSVDCCRPLNSFTSRMEWAACAVIVLAGPPAAGALGVVCLRQVGMGSGYGRGRGRGRGSRVLSPAGAAVAGAVGGAVVWGCVIGFLAFLFGIFAVSMNIRAYRIRKENERYLAQRDGQSPRSSASLR